MEDVTTQLLIGGISALAGCVAYLYKQTRAHYDMISARLSDCEKDRQELWYELARIKRDRDDDRRRLPYSSQEPPEK